MIFNRLPRKVCQICERRLLHQHFTDWGLTERICKACEEILMEEILLEEAAQAKPPKPSLAAQKKVVPYDEIDANVVSLVKALNRYPGVLTMGSCGGHEVITNPSQWPAGTWYVKFSLPANQLGWYLLEHLAWAINHDYRESGRHVVLIPNSPPPYLNTPGKCLSFVIEGFAGENPDGLAKFLGKTQKYLTKKRD